MFVNNDTREFRLIEPRPTTSAPSCLRVFVVNNPPMDDSLTRLTKLFLNFRAARDWRQFHNPKELAVSLVVESAEFLELFQWKTGPELDRVVREKREAIADELADVLHSLLLLAHDLDIDLAAAAEQKIQKMELKYPVDKAKGKPRKYDDLE